MKLLSAEFKNFRLLRNLKIEFSCDPEKNLTVIRAENETGKTTILNALLWCLYGEEALPGKGKNFRMHPIDWQKSEGEFAEIMVSLDFELTTFGKIGKSCKKYRLLRTALEKVNDESWERRSSTIKLFRLKETGSEPIENPESFIKNELPPELKEIFFTDGDRALSFIEADVSKSTKRARVEKAIQALLGLDILEDAIRHVKNSASEINKKVQNLNDDGNLTSITNRISEIEDNIENKEKKLRDLNEQFREIDMYVSDLDKNISEALRKGDKEELSRELESTKKSIAKIEELIKNSQNRLSKIFESEELAIDLSKSILRKAKEKLESLYDEGKIPNTTIPILEERLEKNICICGESLDPNDPKGLERRKFIENSILESRKQDETRKIITDIYYSSKTMIYSALSENNKWPSLYGELVRERLKLEDQRKDLGRKIRSLEIKIDELPATDIKKLRSEFKEIKDKRDEILKQKTQIETQLEGLKKEYQLQKMNRDRLLKNQEKWKKLYADLQIANDILVVLENSYSRITNEELKKVSELMNQIFLEMIGSDPEQGSIIKEAFISKEFDIIVYGPQKRTLDPDRDLNGASRRALTLAFILALTKVSEVEAPNVIDTPLGMMAGYVKRAVLKAAIRESAQLILFLTRSEISECEDIIDEKAGIIITLTNPAHYPKILLNDPGVTEMNIIRCNCDHRSECQICARRKDAVI